MAKPKKKTTGDKTGASVELTSNKSLLQHNTPGKKKGTKNPLLKQILATKNEEEDTHKRKYERRMGLISKEQLNYQQQILMQNRKLVMQLDLQN